MKGMPEVILRTTHKAISMEARNAAKAFIVNDGNLLLLKRRPNDVQMPSIWEVPGGRLDIGENPVEGLKREILEETGLDVGIICPFNVNHFQRKDGQTITMLVFLCKADGREVILSEEHTEFEWVPVEKSKERITDFFHKEIDMLEKFKLLKHV